MFYRFNRVLVASAFALAMGVPCLASPSAYLGPSPYLQFSDSPFYGNNLGYFYLENFEDGALNTPGVTASGGFIMGPGPFTDSVDADDGSIDGSGQNGHSWWSGFPNGVKSITFAFNKNVLGALPTHAGLVFTDVRSGWVGGDYVTFEAFDKNGNSLGLYGPFQLDNGYVTGETGEDRFFGVINTGGISAIKMSMDISNNWECDYLQYGGRKVGRPNTATATKVIHR
jgi:hypothetical protein